MKKRKMKWTNSRVILLTFFLSCILFIGIPYWIWKANGNNTVTSSETIQLTGKVNSIKKTKTSTGRYGKPVIYITLNGNSNKFRIGGSAYRAINPEKIINEIRVGDNIEIDSKPNEIERSEGNSLINKVLEWRGQPMIYGLRKNNINYLTVNQYNNFQENFNSNNFLWGIVLVLFTTGIMIREAYKEKIINETQHRGERQ
jgi:hypothetical protein